MANTKITTSVISADAITGALIADDVVLGGNPTTTTQSAGNDTTRVATTAFVTAAIDNLIDSAPGTMNTLNEIAAAINDDANFNTTVTNLIASKAAISGQTFTGDIQAPGLYVGSTNTSYDFYNNGTSYLNGNVTIDADLTISSAGPSIYLVDSDNNPDYQIKNGNGAFRIIDTTNSADRIHVDTSGIVGVGTTDFTSMGSSSYKGLKVGGAVIQDSGGGNGSATWIGNNAYVGASNDFKHDGGGACSGIQMTTGDINFHTFDGGGGSADATWSPGTARMHIKENGLIGIGTTSPAAALHIETGANSPLLIKSTYSGGGYVEYALGASGAALGYQGSSAQIISSGSDSNLGIRAQSNLDIATGGNTQRFRFGSTGIFAVGGNPSTGLSNSACSIQIIAPTTATADFNGGGFNAGSLLSLDANNGQNHYASIRFTHNGNTEGFFGLVRQTTTSDITDFVWQMYNGTDNAYQEMMRISEVGYPQFPRMGAGSGQNAVQWWSGGGRGGGMLIYVSSSQQYKKDITDCTIDSSKIYNLQAKSFKWNEKSVHEDKEDWGMIAEEVIEHIPELGVYRDGKVDSLQYEKLSVLLLEEIKKLNERIKVLEG